MNTPTIHQYIKEQETAFEQEIQVGDNWFWNFRNHVQMIFHLKHGIFFTGANDWLRSFRQVMLPLLRASYWTEDIELKDVLFFIENVNGRALSFLVKKYHDEVYARENDLDSFFDEVTESDIDFGGALVHRAKGKRPEVYQLTTVAFCDQTNLLGGPIGFKLNFTPDGIRKMAKFGWGDPKNGATMSLEEICVLAGPEKDAAGTTSTKKNVVTGKNIEVYIVRGNLPEAFLLDNDNMEDVYNQLQIDAFYTDKKGKRQNAILYRKKDDEGNLKFHTSQAVPGRGLGYGDGETLLHPQIWSNFLSIHKMNLLEAASKVPLYTDDPAYTNRNRIQDMENLEITTIDDGKTIQQVPTAAPANIQLIEGAINEWFQEGQLSAFAQDPILGKEPNSGTTFRGQERTVAQGRGWHDRRRGKRAKFFEEVYRDFIIPDMVKEICKGTEFLATLSAEELSWVSDQLATNYANKRIKKALLDGEVMTQEEIDEVRQTFKDEFGKQGSRRLLKILKGEFEGIEIRMGINIANKQKDLVNLSDKLLSIFQYVFANPQGFQQAMQIPALAKSFQDILEFSGLNQADFLSLTQAPALSLPQAQPTGPQQPMALNQPVEA